MDNRKRIFELMNKLDSSFKILNENTDIIESGFAKLKRTMHGLSDSINTLGILTAENPDGIKLPPQENKERNNQLKNEIQTMNLGYIRPDFGMYGNKEKPVIIQNISQDDLINLSQKYGQESCILGSKQTDDEGSYFRWDYIERGKIIDTVYHSLSSGAVQNEKDYFTQVKGRKFKIPFFEKIFRTPDDTQKYKY